MTAMSLKSISLHPPLRTDPPLLVSPARRTTFADVTGHGDLEVELRRYRDHTDVAITASFKGIAEPGEQDPSESTVFLEAADAQALGLSLTAGRDAALAERLRRVLISHGHLPQSRDLDGLVVEMETVLAR